MKTRFQIKAVLAIAALLAASCSSIKMQQPFATKGEPVDKAKLEGVWKCGDAIIYLSFASNGVAQLNTPGWDHGAFRVDTGELITAEGRDHNYFCARATSGEASNTVYDLAGYRLLSDDELVFWWPNHEAFNAAIATNKLAGTASGGNFEKRINLSAPPAKVLEFLDDPANANKLFDYTSPNIARKIGPAPR